MTRNRFWIMLSAALAAGCASLGAEPELAAYVPAGAQVVAGSHITAVKKSPLYADLPVFAKDFIEPAGGASEMMVAMGDFGLLTLARGKYPPAPAGFTQLRRGFIAVGPADARSTYAAADLLRTAPKQADLWIAARGTASLPLTGMLSNLNRFLRLTEKTTGAATLTDHAELRVVAFCKDAERATMLEQTVRAFASIASAAGRHTGDVSVRSEASQVHIEVSLSREDFIRLLANFSR